MTTTNAYGILVTYTNRGNDMMLTTKDAAELLKVNASRVRQLILRGELKAQKHGRDWHIAKEEVDKYREERRKRYERYL